MRITRIEGADARHAATSLAQAYAAYRAANLLAVGTTDPLAAAHLREAARGLLSVQADTGIELLGEDYLRNVAPI